MAADTAVRFQASIVDSEGNRVSCVSHAFVDGTSTGATLKTALGAWATALDNVIGGQIIETSLAISVPPSGLKNAPIDDSKVEETGVFDFGNASTAYVYGQQTPSLDDDKAPGGIINLADTDVAAWVTLLLGTVAGGHYTNLSNLTHSALRRAFRSNRRGRGTRKVVTP